jgi:hypothetical protein
LEEKTLRDMPQLAYIWAIVGSFGAYADEGDWPREKVIDGFRQIADHVEVLVNHPILR